MASVKGIAPKTTIMNATRQANNAQPLADAASTNSGACNATMPRYMYFSG